MTLDWRIERIAKNESSFRDINERLEQGVLQAPHAPDLIRFICECGNHTCEELVPLTVEEYEAVRTDSRRFAIVPGHELREAERVVERNDRYFVVEKVGAAVDVTDAADHRVSGTAGKRSGKPTP
jgi:hypothetical protein